MATLFNPIKIWDNHSSDEETLFEEEEEEEVIINSSGSSSPISPSNSAGPLQDMSSLFQQLPNLKRGLSQHYNGKSQSFTCLSNVRCKEDLAKPENPHQKKFKSCKSYAEFPRSSGNARLSRRRNSSLMIIGNINRPPIPLINTHTHTHTSTTTTNFTNQNPAALFA